MSESTIGIIKHLRIKRKFRHCRGKRRNRPKLYEYNRGVHHHLLQPIRKSELQYAVIKWTNFGLVNLRSIRNKVDQVIHHFKSFDFDICAVIESCLKEDDLGIIDDLKSVGISICNIPRTQRAGGGISILSKKDYIVQKTKAGETLSFEFGTFSIKHSGKEILWLLFIVFLTQKLTKYQQLHFWISFQTLFRIYYTSMKKIIIAGDFNIHWNNSDDLDASSLFEIAELYGLQQHVNDPTHVSGNIFYYTPM